MRWFITGCSSGLGRALAERLAEDGEQVVATARRPLDDLAARYPGNLLAMRVDVRDPDDCALAMDAAYERFGRIDVLVNNAGYGQFGAIEEVSDEELADQFATNVQGPWRLVRLIMPRWRADGGGHALFVSSVAGTAPFPGLSAYAASKFALEGMAESLAQEAAHLGVKVTILHCGTFATTYGRNIIAPSENLGLYDHGGMLEGLRHLEELPMAQDPAVFVDAVRRVAAMPVPPLRVAVGADAAEFLTAALERRLKELRL